MLGKKLRLKAVILGSLAEVIVWNQYFVARGRKNRRINEALSEIWAVAVRMERWMLEREMEEMTENWVQGYTHILRVWLHVSNKFNVWHSRIIKFRFVIPFPLESFVKSTCSVIMICVAEQMGKLLITTRGIPALVTIPDLLKHQICKILQYRELLGPFWKYISCLE